MQRKIKNKKWVTTTDDILLSYPHKFPVEGKKRWGTNTTKLLKDKSYNSTDWQYEEKMMQEKFPIH